MKWPFVRRGLYEAVLDISIERHTRCVSTETKLDAAERQLKYCHDRVKRKEGIIAELTQQRRYQT